MVKDYFEDIVPPSGGSGDHRTRPSSARKVAGSRAAPHRAHAPHAPEKSADAVYDEDEPIQNTSDMQQDPIEEPEIPDVGLRSIRNINIPSRPRPRMEPADFQMPSRPRNGGGRLWLWAIAVVCVAALALLALISLRSTVITVIPKSHAIVFDQTSQFVAYPATVAASGTLPYAVQTVEMDDSQIISAQGGTSHVETKASGSITAYNNYSSSPVRLVATTRFEGPGGLIFRTPNDIVIPGKKGDTPASVTVAVIAETAGAQYNLANGVRLTLPGLKSNAAMYKGVYADTTGAMSGGLLGETAATDPAERASAVAALRTRLQEQAFKAIADQSGQNAAIFPGLMQITYQDMPDTTESNGIGVHERIHVSVPVLPADVFAKMVETSVATNAESSSLTLVGGEGYTASSTETATTTLGTSPIHFTLGGTATLVSNVDKEALGKALAGRDQSAFKGIVANFPGIKEARARIEPFWKSAFPEDPKAIKIVVEAPEPVKGSGN